MQAGTLGPDVNAKYAGLERGKKRQFPLTFKHATWCLVAVTVISSCVGLIFYRVSYEMIKTYFWASIILCLFNLGVFVTAPVRIFIFDKLDAGCIKRKPFTIKRKINPSFLANPYDPYEKENILKYRQYNADLYAPMPLSKLKTRMEDIKYNIELRNLTVDIIVHVVFTAVVASIIQIDKTKMGYYSTEIIKDLVLRGSYTNSIPFSKVSTYETFVEYLNETFLPAMLMEFADFNKSGRRRERKWIQEHKGDARVSLDIKKKQVTDDSNDPGNEANKGGSVSAFQKGWTMSPTLKLIGKARLRQIRVNAETCRNLKNLKSRNLECAPDLTASNVERGRFSLGWSPGPAEGLTASEASPWIYRSAWNTRTLPIHGKYSTYPGGGYILELARDIKDARMVLEFLDSLQWVDMRTRAVFIEFTVYCVNTNLFNVVTLIVEKTALGYFIPNYKIDTSKFMFDLVEFEIGFVFLSILFICFLFFFALREGVRIHRTSIGPYLKRGFALADLAIVLLGLVYVIFLFGRYYYVSQLLKKLKESDNDEFISFIYAASWHNWSIYIASFLVCLCAFMLLRLLSFRVVFFQFERTLNHCYVQFINLFIKQMVLTCAFAFFFNLTLANYCYCFRSFDVSLSTMIWRSVAIENTFDFEAFSKPQWYLGALLLELFITVIVFVILFVNHYFVFIAIACLYLQKIQGVSLINKYDILEYIKYLITFKRQSDILHLKEGNAFCEERTDPTVMRLKGGGNRSPSSSSKREKEKKKEKKKEKEKEKRPKKKKEKEQEKRSKKKKEKEKEQEKKRKKEKEKRKKEKEKEKRKKEKEKEKKNNKNKGSKGNVRKKFTKEEEEEDGMKIISKDFVTKKPLDTTKYQDLAEDRAVGIKQLMLSILSKDEKSKTCSRKNALKALFCTFTAAKAGGNKSAHGCYYFVADKSPKKVYDAGRLLQMKKVVEDMARKKGWSEDEEGDSKAVNKAKSRLYTLNKKLCLLLRRHKLK